MDPKNSSGTDSGEVLRKGRRTGKKQAAGGDTTRQAQRMRMTVRERNHLRRRSRPGTNEKKESATPTIWPPVMVVATETAMSKSERSRKPTTIAVKTKMAISRNASHIRQRGGQVVGDVRRRSRILSPKGALHLRIATRTKNRNAHDRSQIHESLPCLCSPRREPTRARALL